MDGNQPGQLSERFTSKQALSKAQIPQSQVSSVKKVEVKREKSLSDPQGTGQRPAAQGQKVHLSASKSGHVSASGSFNSKTFVNSATVGRISGAAFSGAGQPG